MYLYHSILGSPHSLPSCELGRNWAGKAIQHVSCHGCVHLREITSQLINNGCIMSKDFLAGFMAMGIWVLAF